MRTFPIVGALALAITLALALALAACSPAPPVTIAYQGPPEPVRSCPRLLVRYVADGNYTVDASAVNEMWKSQFAYPSGKEFEVVTAGALEAAGCEATKSVVPMAGPKDFAPLAGEARRQGDRYVLLAETKLPKMQIIDHEYEGWARYAIPVYDSFTVDKQTVVLDYQDSFALYDVLKGEVVAERTYARQAKTVFEVAYDEYSYNLALVRAINRLFMDTQSAMLREWLQDMDKALNGPEPESKPGPEPEK